MKKSNVTIIATSLLAIHVVIFSSLIGSSKKSQEDVDKAPVPPPASEPAPVPAEPMADFALPKVTPTIVSAKQKPAKPVDTIAMPGSREGYLRSDRPNRRTSKVYSNLIGDPYRGAIVVDALSGKILYENRATTYCYPASVTKMMTLLIVLEQIDAGAIHLTDKVKITKEVASIGGSEVYLDSRESGFYTVDDLLKALMIHSANDAARALALHVAETRDDFVDMMNQKARELGMNSTVYHTEHGLPPTDGTQPDISTAYDIALLSLAVLRHPKTLGYTGTKLAWLPKSPIRSEEFMLANRNVLVGKEPYPGCDGLKTGYHSRGGFSLAATALRDGHRVVSVVLGVADRNSRNATSCKMLDKGFDALKK